MITILFGGDIVGRPGRRAVKELLPQLRGRWAVDCVITNGENAAGGSGLTPETVREILQCGVHAITSGDHIWRNRAVYDIIDSEERLLRPANFPPGVPGRGSAVIALEGGLKVGIINLIGRVFMKPAECPFRAAVREAESLREETPLIIVDMHAEATSEKLAMGRYLDGRVTAVIGTHTHIQTADEQVFPGGTAYVTEAGMTGPTRSILGREIEPVLEHFITQMPQRFSVAGGDAEFQGVLIRAEERTGKAVSIERVRERISGSGE